MNLQNKAAERALLAGLIQHGQQAYIDCSDLLSTDIFVDDKNAMIFSTLRTAFEKGAVEIDRPTIYSTATSLGYSVQICEKKEDKDFIAALFNFSISADNTREQAGTLYKLHVARRLQSCSQKTFRELDSLTGKEDLNSIITIPESNLTEAINQLSYEDEIGKIGDSVDSYLDFLDKSDGQIGLPTQFPIFNKVIGGGLRVGVNLIVARGKMGKSFFGKEIALYEAKNGIPALIMDTEMTEDDQLARILPVLSGVSTDDIEGGRFKEDPRARKDIISAAEDLKKLPLYHKNVSGRSFDDVLTYIKRWLHRTVGVDSATGKANPHLIVYDYFKMTESNLSHGMKEYEALGYQIAAMHNLCKMYNSPVLAFGQVNRDGIAGEDTNVVAGSDRLLWNCVSLSLFKNKTPEEMAEDGHKGNRKLIPLVGRYMRNLQEGDYINYHLDGNMGLLTELGNKYGNKKDTGFELQ